MYSAPPVCSLNILSQEKCKVKWFTYVLMPFLRALSIILWLLKARKRMQRSLTSLLFTNFQFTVIASVTVLNHLRIMSHQLNVVFALAVSISLSDLITPSETASDQIWHDCWEVMLDLLLFAVVFLTSVESCHRLSSHPSAKLLASLINPLSLFAVNDNELVVIPSNSRA